MNFVTAIIPTYNRADYLGKAITSVLQQTNEVEELIVVDDGSTDNTKEVVEAICQRSKKIIYTYQQNSGPAAARNTGIRMANGKFIAFLDSDDTWDKKKVELQLSAMKRNERYKISHTSERWMRRGVHLNRKKKHLQKHGDIFFQNLGLCAAGMSTIMCKKELFDVHGGFDEEFLCCEDYELWLRIGGDEEFLLIDKPLTVKHGGRDDQVSSVYRLGMDIFRIKALEKLIQEAKITGRKRLGLIEECKRRSIIYAKGCEKHGKIEEAESYLRKVDELNKPENYSLSI